MFGCHGNAVNAKAIMFKYTEEISSKRVRV